MLTKRQKQILDYIEKYSSKKGYAPSLEEVKNHFKLSSVSTVHQHIQALTTKGYVQKFKNQPRGVSVSSEKKFTKIPLLGNIAAGQPIEVITSNETIAAPQEQIEDRGNCYALKVVGNSMVEENIYDGDVVLVKQQATAENGQKVVALIDNENATLKKIYKERGQIRLQPANQYMEPVIIRRDQDLKIQGVVLGVVRNYNSEDLIIEKQKQYQKPIKVLNNVSSNTIIHGDTISALKEFPEKSVDLIVADPPYNLSKGNKINFQNKGLKGFGGKWNKVMENWDDLPFVDYMNFTYEWLNEAKRVLKPSGSIWVFGTYHNIGLINTIFQILGVEIINEVVWYKRNAFPNLAGRRLTASHETLLWAHAGNGKRNYYFDYKAAKNFSENSDQLKEKGKQMRTVWDIPNNKDRQELKFGKHPTQKPLRICRRIISISSKPGDIVLAPFSGVGSECVAAKELGRKYVGIELEKQYVDIAKERLVATNQIKTLFE